MTIKELQSFVDNYSNADFDKIKFDWNGLHADKLQDKNARFRVDLCEFIIPQLNKVNLDLIRDLYIELSKSSKETWTVYNKYHLLAQELLDRGGTKYLIDYLNGARYSFDTYLASAQLKLSREQKETFYNSILSKLKTNKDEHILSLLQFGKERFEKVWKMK